MDLSLPAPGGIETTQRIKRELPSTAIIVLAVSEDEDALFDAIKAGAAAFILKDVGPDDLVTIIRRVVAGEYLINDKVFAKPAVASRVLKEFRELAVYGQDAAPIFAPLSPREVEILDNIAQGMTNKQVAYALSISEQTVEEPHELDPAQAVRERPDPGRGVRHAPGLDPDARGLTDLRPSDPRDPGSTMTDAVTEPTPEPPTEPTVAPPANLAELGVRLTDDVARLDDELVEVDLLITQAKTEAARHEGRRAAAADKLAALPAGRRPGRARST